MVGLFDVGGGLDVGMVGLDDGDGNVEGVGDGVGCCDGFGIVSVLA